MAKNLAQIKAKHEHMYQDEDGKTVTSQTFIKDFTFFEDIEYLYSKDCPDGIKIDSHHVGLYCRFMSYQANGKTCYESQGTLARKHKTSVSTIGRRIRDLKKLGLVTTEPNPDAQYDTLLYTALPLTDAHVIPPDQLPAAPNSDETAAEHAVPDFDDLPFVWDAPQYQPTPTISTQQDMPDLPWGGVAICKPNGDPIDAALKWALTETMGDEEEAYRLISLTATKHHGREIIFTVPTNETFDEREDLPF
ncbi:helix-turn-helix domain-containing protein [Citrobacter werkmanii]|uniref:helix-turn-helix domain-containing protein n=1 Tax=Citrobacter werkmanii TaxID=67827 RepID=UPI001D09FBC4|nr:helix-turn-helix domain-containing protein [Citrobacter werkmanii]UBX46386.1 helix-turn-helix domain-containing protein [Citrobacter werkmanii]